MTQQMQQVKVMVVDDKCLVNEGIAALISKDQSFRVVDKPLSGEACLNMLKNQPVDLIILDHNMPGQTGLQTFKQIKANHPLTKVIALTFFAEESLIKAYIDEKVHGFLLKSDTSAELLFALHQVAAGQQFFSSGVAKILSGQKLTLPKENDTAEVSSLTPAELNVLVMIGQGMSVSEISAKRFTSIKTVNRQKQTIMDKLGIHKETKLMRFAIESGLVS